MNSIAQLLRNPFLSRSRDDQLKIKELGRPLPLLNLSTTQYVHNKTVIRKFNPELYVSHDWLCGCEAVGALFCFPCVLFGGDKMWSSIGYRDLIHLSNSLTKHELNANHIHNVINFSVIGKKSLNELKKAIQQHNLQVDKNLQVLDILIDAIKFCAPNYIPIQRTSNDDSDEFYVMDNNNAFSELLELVYGGNNTLKNYIKTDIFQNDLESMKIDIIYSTFEVYQAEITKEVKEAEFLSVIVEDLEDCDYFQKVILLRYVVEHRPVERVWKLLQYEDVRTLLETLINELGLIIDTPGKLISQSFRELNFKRDVPSQNLHCVIRALYPNAHLVHFYRHSPYDIISNTVDFDVQVRVFLSYIWSICDFFKREPWCKTPKEIFEKLVSDSYFNHRKPWNFESDQINTIYNYKNEIIKTMDNIQDDYINIHVTVLSKALNIADFLDEADSEYWLEVFYKIMPHIEQYFNEYENCLKPIDPDSTSSSLEENLNEALSADIPITFEIIDDPTLVQVKVEDEIEIFQPNIEDLKTELPSELPLPELVPFQKTTSTVSDDVSRKRKLSAHEQMEIDSIKAELQDTLRFNDTVGEQSTSNVSRKRVHREDKKDMEKEVVTCIVVQLQERLKFRGHTFAARLVDPSCFHQYCTDFPESFLEITLGYYPTLNSIRLRAELEVLYDRLEYQALSGASALLKEICESELKSTFQETVRLLNIVLTIPLRTDETGRCFSTMDELNFFSKNCRDIKHLQPLTVLACERTFVDNINEFNQKVARIFAEKPGRAEHFKRQKLAERN